MIRTLYKIAVKIGTQYNNKALAKKKVPLQLALAYHLAYFIVFRKLKERLGFDRVRLGVSGAAPISHEILKFFQSIGIPTREVVRHDRNDGYNPHVERSGL